MFVSAPEDQVLPCVCYQWTVSALCTIDEWIIMTHIRGLV